MEQRPMRPLSLASMERLTRSTSATQNAKKLRGALDGYISKARKVSGKRSSSRKASSGIDNKAVRRWAESNGIELSKRGRIPQDVVSQFRAAGN